MKLIRTILLLIFILNTNQIKSQASYQVGIAQTSIEPDKSIISLHLGGYGAPRDGRFTLQWIKKGEVSPVTSLGSLKDKLYVVSNNELLVTGTTDNNSVWTSAGKAENIVSIAGVNDKLYSVSNKGEILQTRLQKGIKWVKAGTVDNSVTVLTASDNRLFAANASEPLSPLNRARGWCL
jgi:hypothetical protein